MSAKRRDREFDETSEDIAVDEIQEFIDADRFDVNADPAFKQELREKLWELVQSKSRHANARGRSR
jgi:hypothetical protein